MNRRLGATIAVVAIASGILMAAAISYPVGARIRADSGSDGLLLGVVFWVGLTLAGSSLSVRMPGGSMIDVGFAPIVAAMALGGPAAAGWAALIGTTQARELRGSVPWYGVVANRCMVVAPAIASAFVLQAIPGRSSGFVDFAATVGAALVYFSLNFLLTASFLVLRTGDRFSAAVRADAGAWANMLALAPIAWLMAQIYVAVGPWAVPLFAVPLYTTRVAYTRFVEVREMFTETVRSLAEAVDKRDTFTSGHSHRVQAIALDIGRAMKISDDDLEALEWGGLLHDIGKIGVPDAVLLKQDRLTRDERTIMNSHPVLGAEIIAPVRKLAPELPLIRHHHEWFNGSGYPDRLVADEIPRLARILHVADAFEAMTAARPYRMTPLTPEQALVELRKFGGIQFDPEVVDAFVRTKWASELSDPGRPEVLDVPLIGQAAGRIAAVGGGTDGISAATKHDPGSRGDGPTAPDSTSPRPAIA
ncbi:MAG: HD-GYP domain-containing protein [Candidatus Limnocylindrales bacterium]|jgi:putative nucleotidyltransferase with HDIG domain